MQSLPLSIKIRMTQYRIQEWVDDYGYPMIDKEVVSCVYGACGDGSNAFPQKTRQRNQRKSRVWRG